ncbi:MAG: HAMP domain-containing histidine kinase [Dorea sp.]|nr:HAMP domain-containing histidine kinase [Dorea sp.]
MLKSFRLSITCLILFIGILPGTVIKQIIINSYQTRAAEAKLADVQGEISILCSRLGSVDFPKGLASDSNLSELSMYAEIYKGRIMVIDDEYQVIIDTFNKADGKTIVSDLVLACLQGENKSYFDSQNHYLQFAAPIYRDEDTIAGVLLMNYSTSEIGVMADKLERHIDGLLLVTLFIVILYAGISAYMIHRPFRKLERSIEAVADGYSDSLKTVATYSETEQISQSCQRMLERLNALNESRQQFVADVSHELKTPLTSMKVLSDSLLLMGDDAPIEMYQEFMSDISEEIERENKIINNLLALVKIDKNTSAMEIESTDINEMVERVLKLVRPIAASYNIELVYESVRKVTAEIDETKLSLAIMNLVENAIKYNQKNGWVRVTLDADHQNFRLEIKDSGIGIPESEIPHIFERFYRVDKSHSTEIKGTGLGLALTRSIVAMHRGAIQVFSKVGEGTTIIVRVPLIYAMSENGGGDDE